jgi:hypothetical protein
MVASIRNSADKAWGKPIMSKSVIAKRSRAYRLLGTYAVLSFLYTLQAVFAGGSAEAQVPASPGSGRRRGAMVKGAVVVGSLAVALAGIALAGEAGAQVPPLSSLQVPGPANLADFVSDPGAAKVLGKALFWDMQVGSDGVQACATCHFRAGTDPRSKNQTGPGLLQLAIKPGPVVVPDPDFDFDGLGTELQALQKGFPLPATRRSPGSQVVHPIGLEQRGVLAGRAPRDLWPGGPAGPRPRWLFGRTGPPKGQRSPRRAAQHADDDQRGLQASQLLGLRAQNLFNGVNQFLYRADDPSNPRKTTVSLYLPCDSANHE